MTIQTNVFCSSLPNQQFVYRCIYLTKHYKHFMLIGINMNQN